MYLDKYSEEITRKLSRLKKKDPAIYSIARKKMEQILDNPEHEYKELRYSMKGIRRVHIGHFVLIFRLDSINKIVYFEDFDHHDNICTK